MISPASRPLTATLAVLVLFAPNAQAWGAKGHMMAGRVAAQALPHEVPLFFRAASEELAYLIPEPDRWRGEAWGGSTGPRQELTNLTAGNHNIRLELIEGIPFPPSRNEYIVLMVEKGIVPRGGVNMHKVGMVFYAIVEELQRLTVQFRLWREAQEAATLDPTALKQIQQNAIFSAGILGHWVTDSAQPLHVTVHSDDWDSRFPNPRNYVTKGIHGRFESVYVDRAISETDIRGRLTPARILRDWRSESEAHIRRSFSYFEKVYELDVRGSFGSGNEAPEAHGFTTARLAEGASMLRDAWYSAWKASEEELFNTPVRYLSRQDVSPLETLRTLKRVETRGDALVSIGSRREGLGNRKWKLYASGKPVAVAPGRYRSANIELIEWRFER